MTIIYYIIFGQALIIEATDAVEFTPDSPSECVWLVPGTFEVD